MERVLLELRRVGVRLSADRRRFALLCMLTAVGAVFWTRLILMDQQPAAAAADTIEVQAPQGPETTAAAVPVEVLLPERPRRNPFSVDNTFFPIAEETSTACEDSPKSEAHAADLTAEAVSALRLGATLPPSTAVIDGMTLRVGTAVPGPVEPRLTLVEVHRSHAVLEAKGRRFVLRME
ncbi:MAG: hypothetical protein MK101_07100 [Phycisphaerales bacterium]|nr:hypothetical protein [Phycisphaerales bacterium]